MTTTSSLGEQGHRAAHSERHAIVLAAQPSQIEDHAARVLALLPPPLRADDVRIGLVEALGNAIVHGALGVSYESRQRGDIEATLTAIEEAAAHRGAGRTVSVEIAIEAPGAEVTIADSGAGFDWREQTARDGLGLIILRSVFAAVRWNDRGNAVTLCLAPRP